MCAYDRERRAVRNERFIHWNEIFELIWTPPRTGSTSPSPCKRPLDVSCNDWQHCLYCRGGQEYAPTGVGIARACVEEGETSAFTGFDGVGVVVFCPIGTPVVRVARAVSGRMMTERYMMI